MSTSNPATGTARYYLADYSGSTRRLRDSSKSSLAAYEYDPYGDAYSESGASTSIKYTGHAKDDTSGLYRTMHRQYSSSIGRWISRDPIGRADGPNLFAGMRNSPMANVDPLGLSCCSSVLADPTVDQGAIGFVACCGSSKKVCVVEANIRIHNVTDEGAVKLAKYCTRVHETTHLNDPNSECRSLGNGLGILKPTSALALFQGECNAYTIETNCIKDNKKEYCRHREDCRKQIEDIWLPNARRGRDKMCDCVNHVLLCILNPPS